MSETFLSGQNRYLWTRISIAIGVIAVVISGVLLEIATTDSKHQGSIQVALLGISAGAALVLCGIEQIFVKVKNEERVKSIFGVIFRALIIGIVISFLIILAVTTIAEKSPTASVATSLVPYLVGVAALAYGAPSLLRLLFTGRSRE